LDFKQDKPELSQTRVAIQVIKVKYHHNLLINIIPLSYLRTNCHKQAVTHIRESRLFESMYTLQGKADTHDTYASCTGPRTSHVCFLRAVSVRGNLSR
jgi:hypothetical protein